MKSRSKRSFQREIKTAISDFSLTTTFSQSLPTANPTIQGITCIGNPSGPDQTDSEGSVSISDISELFSSDDSQSGSASEPDSGVDIRQQLVTWAIKHNITGAATNDLLKLLKQHPCFTKFPTDSRSFLQTPRETPAISVPPGQYVAFDWLESIRRIISNHSDAFPDNSIIFQVNADGIPLYRSSSQEFWPILGAIGEEVFIIGIYCGNGKPQKVNEFLSHFVKSFKDCGAQVVVNDNIFKIKIRPLICDAPARAFVLGAKGHSGYSCCGKCTIKGVNFMKRVTFPYGIFPERTNFTFRNRADPPHHNETTILQDLDLDLVDDVPFEYMHLVCLGVMRKLLKLWTKGKKCPGRLRRHEIEAISRQHCSLSKYIPSEFSRKPRRLKDVDHWKATEFRQFLLYTGPVVLKNNISKPQYEHFLSLHISISILAHPEKYKTYNSYANELLHYFVQHFGTLYGMQYMSYNIHGLLHLAKDSLIHGALDKYSAFKFENKLQTIKKLVRGPTCPLQQAHRRLNEREAQQPTLQDKASQQPFMCPWDFHKQHDLPMPNSVQYFKKYQKLNFHLGGKYCDSICEIQGGAICVIETFVTSEKEQFFLGKKFKESGDYFNSPCRSSKLLHTKLVTRLGPLEHFPVSVIRRKVVLLPVADKYFAAPLIHLSQ